jgi:hypothetical protein
MILPVFELRKFVDKGLHVARKAFVGMVKQPQSAPIFLPPSGAAVSSTAKGSVLFHAEETRLARISSSLITTTSL